jgi:hypothetical protein
LPGVSLLVDRGTRPSAGQRQKMQIPSMLPLLSSPLEYFFLHSLAVYHLAQDCLAAS